jgi:hypothetical protein
MSPERFHTPPARARYSNELTAVIEGWTRRLRDTGAVEHPAIRCLVELGRCEEDTLKSDIEADAKPYESTFRRRRDCQELVVNRSPSAEPDHSGRSRLSFR